MNSKTATNTSTEAMLNQTELGSFIGKHRNSVISFVALLIVAVLGYTFFANHTLDKNLEKADQLTAFKNEKLKLFSEDKLSAEEVVSAYTSLQTNVGDFFGLAPLAVTVSDELVKKGKSAEATTILSAAHDRFAKKGQYIHFLLGTRLAVLFEDQGKFAEAAKVLEGILSAQVKVMEDKVRLDLARVYVAAGDSAKAKLNIDYVIEKGTDNKMISLARAFKLKYKI